MTWAINASDYGVIPDGVFDNSAAMLAAQNAAMAGNKTILLPAGEIFMAAPPSLIDHTNIRGAGETNTILRFAPNIGGIAAGGYTAQFQDFAVKAPGSIPITLGADGVINSKSYIERVRFFESDYGISAINCRTLRIKNNIGRQISNQFLKITSPINSDAGDNSFIDNDVLNSDSLTGTGYVIGHYQGGGWKIAHNKLNGFQYGYFMIWTPIPGNPTGVVGSSLIIDDNSIEGMSVAMIALINPHPTGDFYNVVITSNQGGSNAPGLGIATGGNPANRKWLHRVGANNNTVTNVGGGNGLQMAQIDFLTANGNTVVDHLGSSGVGIDIDASVGSGICLGNTIANYATKVSNRSAGVYAAGNGP